MQINVKKEGVWLEDVVIPGISRNFVNFIKIFLETF